MTKQRNSGGRSGGRGLRRVLLSLFGWLIGVMLIFMNVKIIALIQHYSEGQHEDLTENDESITNQPPRSHSHTITNHQNNNDDKNNDDDVMLQYMLNGIEVMTMPISESPYYQSRYRSNSTRINSRTTIVLPHLSNLRSNNSNIDDNSFCSCNLLSLDCLDSIRCLRSQTQQQRYATSFVGIRLRRTIKETALYNERWVDERDDPIGKQLQYSTISTWSVWRKGYAPQKESDPVKQSEDEDDSSQFAFTPLVLPVEYDSQLKSRFVEHKWYKTCRRLKLKGKSCFFTPLSDKEDLAGAAFERSSLRWGKSKNFLRLLVGSPTSSQRAPTDTTTTSSTANFRERSSSKLDVHPTIHERLHDLISVVKQSAHHLFPNAGKNVNHEYDKQTLTLSPTGELLTFANIMRILFNRRPFLDGIFQAHLTSIEPTGTATESNATKGSSSQPTADNEATVDPFILAVHIRRGDSCSEKNPSWYRENASPIDSPPQVSSERQCYMTSVYLNAVRRIRELVPSDRPVHVYLSTDDVGSVMDEIQQRHNELFTSIDQWKFLNYSRSHFQYKSDFIEDDENENRPILGETAVADLWLLSHGEAFVGHLGSRFGKTGWLLATARRNNLVPYFSVDGHSFCCEIDEDCGKMSEYITDMENCLTFGHDYLEYELGNKYWEVGSLARKWAYKRKQNTKSTKKS